MLLKKTSWAALCGVWVRETGWGQPGDSASQEPRNTLFQLLGGPTSCTGLDDHFTVIVQTRQNTSLPPVRHCTPPPPSLASQPPPLTPYLLFSILQPEEAFKNVNQIMPFLCLIPLMPLRCT